MPTPRKSVATPAPPAPPKEESIIRVAPVLPKVWTIATVVAYAAAAAMFVIGILTAAGVVLPSGVSANVQAWSGILLSLVGLVTPLLVLISKNGVVKSAIAAGMLPHEAVRSLG